MAWKLIRLIAGVLTETEAIITSAGAADSGKIPALDAAGKIASNMMPTGIGADTKNVVTSENLAAGDLVNIYNNGGVSTARKADASNGRRAHGFTLVAVTSPAAVDVYLENTITGLTGLTAGVTMYLSGSTAGAATATAPSTSAYISQEIGAAMSTTEISFEPQQPVTLA